MAQAAFLVLTGKVASAGVGFLSTLLVARALGEREFGLFSFALAVMVLVSWLSGGTIELGMVRSFAAHTERARAKADAVLRVALRLKLAVGLSLAVVGWVLAEPVALGVFHKPEFILPLQYGFVGALGLSLWGYILATLQARQAFRDYVCGDLASNLCKLGLVGFLLCTAQVNVTVVLLVYILVSYLWFIVGLAWIPATQPATRTERRAAWGELLGVGKWLAVSWLCASVYTRLDMLMLGYFREAEALGVYALAFTLVAPLDLIASTLFTVLLPKASRCTQPADLRQVLKLVLIGGGAMALLLLAMFPLAEGLLETWYGADFAATVPVFRLLLFGPVFALIGLSASAVLLALNKPHILAANDMLLLIAIFAGHAALIPLYGALGAAMVVLAARAVAGLGIFAYAYRATARSH